MNVEPVAAEQVAETIIKPSSGIGALNFREFYDSRYLLWNLIRRNVRAPYIDLSFGVFWTLVRPILFVLVFFLIKRRSNADMKQGLEYVLYVYSGIILWWYFINSAGAATKSIYNDASLITKVYYPRIITPIVPIVSGTTDFFIQSVLVPIGMVAYLHFPDWHILMAPLILVQVMVLALGVGLITASLSVGSRDFISIQKYVFYLGLFLSPVIYSSALISERLRWPYYILNPMAAPLEAFRACLFSGCPFPWAQWSASFLVAGGILVLGVACFRRVEADLADCVS